MKKAVSLIMAAIMTVLLCVTAVSAADSDITFSESKNYTVSFVKYGSFTVKSGVTLTLVNCGFEIAGQLTVEDGGSLIGVSQAGDFCFSLKRGCKVSGVELYYPSNNGGKIEYYQIPLSVFDDWSKIDDEAMAFKWNTEINGWCLTHEVGGNPFGIVFYHTERDMDMAQNMANELYSVGLFKGTGTKPDGTPEFSLNRAPTRVEALVMLVRLLGKEDEALDGQWNNPFTDVPDWADKYIGYAYEKGLTKGVSATSYGTGNATMQQYLTFVLRALGYSDEDTSSTLYDEAVALGNSLRLIRNDDPQREYLICEKDFWRADVAVISHRALETNTKNGETLRESLKR